MDTEKQRQRRRDDARLTESGNETELLTNRQRMLGELLSGSERRRPGWFLDMKYETCVFCCGETSLQLWYFLRFILGGKG